MCERDDDYVHRCVMVRVSTNSETGKREKASPNSETGKHREQGLGECPTVKRE